MTSTTAQWRQFIVNWNSGSNVSATIKIVDINLDFGGNDFTLDDLVFDANVSQYFGVTDITDVNNDGIIVLGAETTIAAIDLTSVGTQISVLITNAAGISTLQLRNKVTLALIKTLTLPQ